MNISPDDGGALKRFRKNPLFYQSTFPTPLKSLDSFVAEILTVCGPVKEARLMIDQIVFEPKALQRLLDSSLTRGSLLEAYGENEIRQLLQAALSDSIDFFFVPTPKSLVIYADHDEYCTFYAARKSPLSQLSERLGKTGIQPVHEYQRSL